MYVPFHITFQSQCFTVIGCDAAINTSDTGGVDEAVYISDWSLTQFRVSISSDRSTITYIAFGIQQWGVFSSNMSSAAATISFNLTHPSNCVGVLTCFNNNPTNYAEYVTVYNVTANTFSIITYANNSGSGYSSPRIFWLSVGCQQWGYSSSRTATYPISFSSYVYAAVGCPNTTYTSATATGVANLGLSSMGIYLHGSKGWYFVVGRQQWGVGVTPIQFPIAFPVACLWVQPVYNVNAIESKPAWYACYANNISATGFTNGYNESLSTRWYAIGKQQWGYDEDVADNEYISFPISFSEVYSVSITSKSESDYYLTMINIPNVTNNNFKVSQHGTNGTAYTGNYYWIAIGCQQWGKLIDVGKNYTASLNISYASQNYGVFLCSITGDAYGSWTPNVSTTSFVSNFYNTAHASKTLFWFSVGIQQWGYVSTTSYPNQVNFPITFASYVACIHVTPVYEGGYTPSGYVYGNVSTTSAKLNAQRWLNASYHTEMGQYYWTAMGYQQWGFSVSDATAVTFPVSMNDTNYLVLISFQDWTGDQTPRISYMASRLRTAIGFSYGQDTSAPRVWLALGQQWGDSSSMQQTSLVNANADGYTCAYTLPISYTSFYQPIGSHPALANDDYTNFSIVNDLSSIAFRFRSGSPMKFITIGIQQWGIWNTNRSYGVMECTFPVSNTSETLCVLATYFDSTDVSNGAILIKPKSNSACILKVWSYTKVAFFAIGT